MPAKRRAAKRRISLDAEIEAWTDVFLFGADFSKGLEKAGVPITALCPDRATLEEAWRRLGERFLARWGGPGDQEIWANRELGDPHAT